MADPDEIEANDERLDIARYASYEIEGLMQALIDEADRRYSKGADSGLLALRALAMRAYELNSVVMSIAGQEDRETRECYLVVHGRAMPVGASHA